MKHVLHVWTDGRFQTSIEFNLLAQAEAYRDALSKHYDDCPLRMVCIIMEKP